MTTVKDLIKDQESINKYTSKVIHGKIGSSLLIRKKTNSNTSNEDESWKKQDIQPLIHHVRKILTTDKRVLEVQEFPEINDKTYYVGYYFPKAALGFDKPSTEGKDYDYNIYKTMCSCLELNPFRLKIEVKSIADEDDILNILYEKSEITSDCWIYWNGSTYLAYTTNISPDIYFAHRARDIIQDIYKDSELLNVANIGPCPIHPDINICIFSKEKLGKYYTKAGISGISFAPFCRDDDIYISVLLNTEDKVESSIHGIAKAVFWELHRYIETFYRAMTTRSLLLKTTGKCHQQFEQLSHCLLSIHGLPTRALFDKRRKIRELGLLTTELNMTLSKEYELNVRLKDIQKDIFTLSKERPIKSLFFDYLQEHTTESECTDRQSISNALVHSDQVLSRHTVFNIQLISAIIGGIIGGITAVSLIYLSTFLINLNTQ